MQKVEGSSPFIRSFRLEALTRPHGDVAKLV
jgi:hypothetical protein